MKEPGANEDAADPSPNAKGSGSRPTGFAATTPMSSALAQSLVRGVSHDAATVVAPDSLRAPSRGPAPLGERYRLGDVIGAGGMGEVRLFQDQWIGRDVAMKTLHPELAVRGDAKSRFLREIRVQGQLEHPSTQPMKAFSGSPRASMHARARAKEESTFRPSSRPYVFARLRVLCRIASRRPKTSPIAWSIDHRDPLHEYRLRAFAIHLSDEAQRHVECGGRSDLLTGMDDEAAIPAGRARMSLARSLPSAAPRLRRRQGVQGGHCGHSVSSAGIFMTVGGSSAMGNAAHREWTPTHARGAFATAWSRKLPRGPIRALRVATFSRIREARIALDENRAFEVEPAFVLPQPRCYAELVGRFECSFVVLSVVAIGCAKSSPPNPSQAASPLASSAAASPLASSAPPSSVVAAPLIDLHPLTISFQGKPIARLFADGRTESSGQNAPGTVLVPGPTLHADGTMVMTRGGVTARLDDKGDLYVVEPPGVSPHEPLFGRITGDELKLAGSDLPWSVRVRGDMIEFGKNNSSQIDGDVTPSMRHTALIMAAAFYIDDAITAH